MKNTLRLLTIGLLTLGACGVLSGRADSIKVDAFQPTAIKVCDRHDDYVRNDPALSDVAEAAALAQSSDLLSALSSAIDGKVLVPIIEENTRAVCARHDEYVVLDAKLEAFERDIYLRSTTLMLRVIDQAASGASSHGADDGPQ